jgi:isochorismate hydrolase
MLIHDAAPFMPALLVIDVQQAMVHAMALANLQGEYATVLSTADLLAQLGITQ